MAQLDSRTDERSRYSPHPGNRVELRPGDRVRVELPYSEAMMAARKAGTIADVVVGCTSAQLLDAEGEPWGAPYLPSECGIYGGLAHGFYAYGTLVCFCGHAEGEHGGSGAALPCDRCDCRDFGRVGR